MKALANRPVLLVIATHSTALLRAFADADARVAFMRRGVQELAFKAVTEVDRSILPIFGAHPLSNVFNEAPILLIEGEDDERVWQQAVRSAKGAIRLYPCVVDGLTHFAEYESEVNNMIESVYDNARAYSLRDRDDQPELIADIGHVGRMRLSCRAAENLMLSDDVLTASGTDWPTLQARISTWVEVHSDHQYRQQMLAFVEGGPDRKGHDLKEIRNILIGEISNKPWEVLVGQTIASVVTAGGAKTAGSLRDFLGERVCSILLGLGA